jgi:threonyl-tRNA synthetase
MKEKQAKKLEIKRHSMAHILATAVLEMFPEAKLGIGPATENGFYYDFDLPRTLIPEDLEIIEEKMKKVIEENYEFVMKEMEINEAIEHFKKANQPLKVELLENLKNDGEKMVSIYKSGPLVDLCKGPHIQSTGEIDSSAFKLTKISGAYWLGDENKQQLQRIYGVVFNNKKELKQYLFQQEEAKKRDHRKLGKELDLFTIDQNVGSGLPLWKPKGAIILNTLKRWFEDEQLKRGYIPVITPHIGKKTLWETSGHWGFYNDSMFPPLELGQTLEDYQDNRPTKESEIYLLKPMNCPFHVSIYNDDKHSYRDLPIKYYEFGTVYRYEKKGELGGLTRVRGFTQDDAHLICTREQLSEEMGKIIDFVQFVLEKTFGFELKIYASFRDKKSDKYLGGDEKWEVAEQTIENILQERKLNYVSETGEAAFYGPKIDFKVKDAIGRYWQLSTIQFDFNLPERFKMTYTDNKGLEQQPFIIHRALLGSLERFMGVLIEHYAGAFPTWLAPVQVGILPVSEKFTTYAQKINSLLQENDIRTEIHNQDEGLGKRIALATKQKIPYLLILGEKEEQEKTVTIRQRGIRKQKTVGVNELVELLEGEIRKKK